MFGGFSMKNKALVLGLVLSVVAALFAHAQQFNPESDFQVARSDDGASVIITGYVGTSQTVNIPPRIRQLPVTVIGVNAFQQKNITSVTIPDSVTVIGNNAFSGCESLTSVTIPDSVTTIGDSAFIGCNMTSVIIPDSVTTIGNSAFSFTGLTSVIIPDSVTTIGDSAFWSCSNLTSVTIPDSVTNIGSTAFYRCTSLISVTVHATAPPTLGVNRYASFGVFESTHQNMQILVPEASVNAYRTASGWRAYASRIYAIW